MANKSPNPNARDESVREEHLVRISHWYLSNETQQFMADQLGVSQQTISNDIAEIKKRWLASSLVNYDEKMNQVLARIDWIEVEAIEAWKRSKATIEENVGTLVEAVVGKQDKAAANVPAKRTTRIARRQRDGSAVWLGQIAWCVEQRCKIFDLYAAKDLTPTEVQEIMNNFADAVRREARNEYQEMRDAQAQNKEFIH